eukprot:s6700_g4.t1
MQSKASCYSGYSRCLLSATSLVDSVFRKGRHAHIVRIQVWPKLENDALLDPVVLLYEVRDYIMGVPSQGQIRAAKAEARAAANKTGRHRQILTKKKLKRDRNRDRNVKKKQVAAPERGRAEASGTVDVKMARSPSKIKPGHGSGTPGARAAAAKVPKAVQVSKKGGRRRKATWRSHGVG